MKKVVIVESPSKAKSISQYLGKEYKVLASCGHVRDLVSKTGSVDPDNDFALTWQVVDKAKKHLDSIKKEIDGCNGIILATDLDREGEAISWHLTQYFKNDIKNGIPIERISFHSVTKESVLDAIKKPRDINKNLVDAYLARLSLDFLVGFTLSPVLWRKLPGSRSAGRVQSVALRIVSERELEIESFKKEEYWSIDATFNRKQKDIQAKLFSYDGKKLEKMSIRNETEAEAIRSKLDGKEATVTSVEKTRVKRQPYAPFITSTMQQDASRRLGFSPKKTMLLAQRLYEGIAIGKGELTGLITYMRTDSVHMDESFIHSCREYIKNFGEGYLPEKKRTYKNKSKNTQEAHEAIRPTSVALTPKEMAAYLDSDQLKLYDLVWKRAVASQMSDAKLDQTSVDISCGEGVFRATGSVLIFDGFLSIYKEDVDEEKSETLPPLSEGDLLDTKSIDKNQHFTQPPPRYSEASLIKKMEELGIGRPSTYAHVIQILIDRKYAKLEQKKLVPEERGITVSIFLEKFFSKYVDYGFTADMEEQLDEISGGKKKWKEVLRQFWDPFIEKINESKDITIQEVLSNLEKERFKAIPEEKLICPLCKDGKISLRIGKFGPFVSCSRYPECKYTAQLDDVNDSSDGQEKSITKHNDSNRILGKDPLTNAEITVKNGPYGWYLQWAEDKIKNIAIPEAMFNKDTITIDDAMWLKGLPYKLGEHSDGGQLLLGIGRFGPYIKYNDKFFSIPKKYDPRSVGVKEAETIIKSKKK